MKGRWRNGEKDFFVAPLHLLIEKKRIFSTFLYGIITSIHYIRMKYCHINHLIHPFKTNTKSILKMFYTKNTALYLRAVDFAYNEIILLLTRVNFNKFIVQLFIYSPIKLLDGVLKATAANLLDNVTTKNNNS